MKKDPLFLLALILALALPTASQAAKVDLFRQQVGPSIYAMLPDGWRVWTVEEYAKTHPGPSPFRLPEWLASFRVAVGEGPEGRFVLLDIPRGSLSALDKAKSVLERIAAEEKSLSVRLWSIPDLGGRVKGYYRLGNPKADDAFWIDAAYADFARERVVFMRSEGSRENEKVLTAIATRLALR